MTARSPVIEIAGGGSRKRFLVASLVEAACAAPPKRFLSVCGTPLLGCRSSVRRAVATWGGTVTATAGPGQ